MVARILFLHLAYLLCLALPGSCLARFTYLFVNLCRDFLLPKSILPSKRKEKERSANRSFSSPTCGRCGLTSISLCPLLLSPAFRRGVHNFLIEISTRMRWSVSTNCGRGNEPSSVETVHFLITTLRIRDRISSLRGESKNERGLLQWKEVHAEAHRTSQKRSGGVNSLNFTPCK